MKKQKVDNIPSEEFVVTDELVCVSDDFKQNLKDNKYSEYFSDKLEEELEELKKAPSILISAEPPSYHQRNNFAVSLATKLESFGLDPKIKISKELTSEQQEQWVEVLNNYFLKEKIEIEVKNEEMSRVSSLTTLAALSFWKSLSLSPQAMEILIKTGSEILSKENEQEKQNTVNSM